MMRFFRRVFGIASRQGRGAVVLAFALLLGMKAGAQTSIKVDAPNIVGSDEQFNVTFIIDGEDRPSSFSWDHGDDFTLVWGPQQGSSTSVQIVNGKRTKTSQFTYIYILKPVRTGKCTIPPAVARIKNSEISSRAVTVDVLASGSSSGSQSSQQGSGSQSRNSSGNISAEDLYLKLSLSRSNVVIGEPVTAELKLYQRVDIAGFEGARFPSFNGFWSQETAAPSNIEFQREDVGGKIYNSALLRRYVIIPQQAGTLTIDPAELICLVNVRTSNRTSNSIFDSFFDDGYTTVRKRITSPSVKVDVRPLPSGAPADFGGGVGSFKISARLSKDQLKTHEATSLIVTLSGRGNVSLLEAPKISFPPDLEVYDTKVTENVDKSTGGTTGSKVFEYPFIPRSHGDFTIGPVNYSYYDVNAGKYVTVSAGTIDFNVEKGASSGSASIDSPVVAAPDRKGVRNLGEDIRFISGDAPEYAFKKVFLVDRWYFWMAAALLVLLALIVWYVFRGLAARRADVAGTRNRRATKMALGRLKTAGGYLSQNLYSAFYEELHKALLGFISDKLNIGAEELNKDNIASRLSDGGVDQTLVEEFVGLLDACEFARYSPESGNEAMSVHYNQAVKVISSIDSIMKSHRKAPAASGAALLIAALMAMPYAADAEGTEYLDSLWRRGVDAYTAGQFQESVDAWKSVENAGVESAELYYNLGNAYFKTSDNAHAVLYYERALKLDPSFSDARFNLEFAESMNQDKIEIVPEFILKSWARKICYLMKSDTWALLSLLLLAAFLGLVLLFLLGRTPAARRAGFYSAILALLLSAGSYGSARWQRNIYLKADYAIVMRPVSSVKSSPSAESSKDLFVLHEGTKVNVLDSVGKWYKISLSDGRQGWINEKDIEII
ncbi:MAG: BatD family protein [Candidatus Cryptobacteroides sp.]